MKYFFSIGRAAGAMMILVCMSFLTGNTPLVYPEVKVTVLPVLPQNNEAWYYAIDEFSGSIFVAADKKGVAKKDLSLSKLVENKWVRISEVYAEFESASLFNYDGKLYWAVTVNSERSQSKMPKSRTTLFLVNDKGIETVFTDIEGQVRGMINYKEQQYIYGMFNPQDMSKKGKGCGLMRRSGNGWEPIYNSVVSAYYDADFYDCVQFQDKLVFCGGINVKTSNSKTANGIVCWDGENWVNPGFNEDEGGALFLYLETYKEKLYLSGNFTNNGKNGTVINNILSWDGKGNIDNLKTGLTQKTDVGYVSGMVSYSGQLLCSGQFNMAGDEKIEDLALWDGEHFKPVTKKIMSSNTNSTMSLKGICTDGKKLLVWGDFSKINETRVNDAALLEIK